MYYFIIRCLHFGIDFCPFVYVAFLFCSKTNYIQCCAIGPIKYDGKNTIYNNISCSKRSTLTIPTTFPFLLFQIKKIVIA